jgi:hypothetical protein
MYGKFVVGIGIGRTRERPGQTTRRRRISVIEVRTGEPMEERGT